MGFDSDCQRTKAGVVKAIVQTDSAVASWGSEGMLASLQKMHTEPQVIGQVNELTHAIVITGCEWRPISACICSVAASW